MSRGGSLKGGGEVVGLDGGDADADSNDDDDDGGNGNDDDDDGDGNDGNDDDDDDGNGNDEKAEGWWKASQRSGTEHEHASGAEGRSSSRPRAYLWQTDRADLRDGYFPCPRDAAAFRRVKSEVAKRRREGRLDSLNVNARVARRERERERRRERRRERERMMGSEEGEREPE